MEETLLLIAFIFFVIAAQDGMDIHFNFQNT